jgi:hypothetical protein
MSYSSEVLVATLAKEPDIELMHRVGAVGYISTSMDASLWPDGNVVTQDS